MIFRDRAQLPRLIGALAGALLAVVAIAGGVISAPSQAGAQGNASSAVWQPVYNHDFPDPTVIEAGGVYYAYSTQVYLDSVPFLTSSDGVHWSQNLGDAMPNLASWATFGYTWGPAVAQAASGQYVLLYAALDTAAGTECIGEATSSSPAGPFVDPNSGPVLCDPSAGGDIDPDIFTDPSTGQRYLIWKVNGNSIGQPSSLWSVPLSPNLAITGTPSELLSDDQPWQAGVVEGPAMVFQGGTYDLFYSGNGYSSSSYAIGYATCASPVGPCTDNPANPVLVSATGMTGPGGPSFFQGPAGLQMAFSAWNGPVGYAQGGYRALYVASASFLGGDPSFSPIAGYRLVARDGGLFSFNAPFYGSMGGQPLNQPIVGMASDHSTTGYWEVASDGGIFAFNAPFEGSMGGQPLNQPIVGMAATPDDQGYWEVARDGGIFSFGDATFYGSMGGKPLNKPIVGMAATPDGGGYWEVASDGGIFAFGDAAFYGSTGSLLLNKPVVGMASTPDGGGYWLVASDGGIFAFGDAAFYGSMGGKPLNQPIVGLAATDDGQGYWEIASDGGIFAFGDALFLGSMGGVPLNQPVVGMAAS